MIFLDLFISCFTLGIVFTTVWRHQAFKVMYIHFNLKTDPSGILIMVLT